MSRGIACVTLWISVGIAHAQDAPDYQTDFPPEEFKARWAKVYDRIGDKAVAIVSGLPQVGGFALKLTTQRGYLQGYAVAMLFGIAVILIVVFI